eukprot:3905080-Rhodomonas_salina.1
MVYPQQSERRARDQEMLHHICAVRAEHILDSHVIRPYVPPYDPSELEDWTSHMDAHSRAGIHQLHLTIETEADSERMASGRKKKQLLAAIAHMRRDIMATRRSPARTQIRRSPQRYGVIMRRPSTRLILQTLQTSPASASARNGLDPGLCDVLSLPAQQPSLGATDFML